MTDLAGKPTRPKRPAIVLACTIIFGVLSFLALGVVAVLLKAVPGRVGFFILIPAALTVNTFIFLLFAVRSLITYYITSVTLTVLSLKSLYFAMTFKGHIPPLDPSSPWNRIGGYLLTLAFCFLFWRYALARPSRSFYGIPRSSEK